MELLDEMGLETVWVARKHPFLVYLFLGIFPLVFFGDPIAPLII
jgi:prepilin signal peptidase PulO-like enzyme (type II secretory pathway)